MEVEIGSDPLVPNSHFDVTRTASGSSTLVSANIVGLDADQVNSFAIISLPADQSQFPEETPGYIDSGFEFQVREFAQAQLTFTFDPSLQGPDFDPAIYTYDEDSQRLIEVPNQTIAGNSVSATVPHFSKYILLNRTKFSEVWVYSFLQAPDEAHTYDNLDVVFVIDSSGSMTSNDPARERIQVAKNFVARLGVNDRAAVVDFDSGAIVRSGFTGDVSVLNAALDRIDSYGGTNIGAGVSRALSVFDPATPGTLRTVILLTDGQGSYSHSLTTQAANGNIVIHTVGLG